MPSTDIDGNVVVILTEIEALRVINRLINDDRLDEVERGLIHKIARDLKLEI